MPRIPRQPCAFVDAKTTLSFSSLTPSAVQPTAYGSSLLSSTPLPKLIAKFAKDRAHLDSYHRASHTNTIID